MDFDGVAALKSDPAAVFVGMVPRLISGWIRRAETIVVMDADVKKEIEGKAPRILIVRLSAIGDCVLTVPLVHALRERIPGAHVSWIVDERSAPLLDGLPGLDELLVIPRRWHRSISSMLRIRRALLQRKFDITLDPQSLTKSGLISLLSGAPKRFCFARPVGRELGPWFGNVRIRPTQQHVVNQALQFMEFLGLQLPSSVKFELPQYPGTDAVLKFASVATGSADNFTIINVGAGWPSKYWSADRFAQVARYLGEHKSMASIVVWHGAERDMAVEVVAQSGGHAHLAPATNLQELATLSRAAYLFIGADTGPLHLASAVGTRCVGLYGPTDPAHCGPYGAKHRTVQPDSSVRLVRMRQTKANIWMQRISVDQVIAACQELLQDADAVAPCSVPLHGLKPSHARCAATASHIGHPPFAKGINP